MDVVRSNFEELFPHIKKTLQNCDFIAIDAEFTGLRVNENQPPSLFDQPDDRYKKLKETVRQFTVCQFGISAFVKHTDILNTYEACTYNFHLFPTSFGQIDNRFLCQASSLEFLCHHKHDFNKFIYEGIPYLNSSQKAQLKEICFSKHVKVPLMLNRELESQIIHPECKKIESWIQSNDTNDLVLQYSGALLQFIIYQEIRKKFKKLKCTVCIQGKLVLTKTSSDEKPSQDDREQIEKIITSSCGFSRIFDLLTELKKPLVGHNLLTDLLFMYEKFYQPLPEEYIDFKTEIHKLLPYIFDTKHVAFSLNKHEFFMQTDILKNSNLEGLYSELSSHKGLYYVLYTPRIVHAEACKKYNDVKKIHEAGYDAFISGYVFLRMSHIYAAKTMGEAMDSPLEFRQYFDLIRKFGNFINISRSSLPYLNIAGEDPASNRPPWLIVGQKNSNKRITPALVLQHLEQYGSLDVKILDNQRALVATVHSNVSQRIVAAVKRHDKLTVRNYYPIWDLMKPRTIMLTGGLTLTILCGGIAALYFKKKYSS